MRPGVYVSFEPAAAPKVPARDYWPPLRVGDLTVAYGAPYILASHTAGVEMDVDAAGVVRTKRWLAGWLEHNVPVERGWA